MIITALKNQLDRDINRQKKIVQKDTKQHLLHWNDSRKVFLGIDESGVEWIKGVNTEVPCYWKYCPNEIDYVSKGVMSKRRCNKPHFIPIFKDGDSMTCVECHYSSKIEIILPSDAPQYKMLQQIRNER